MVLYTRENILRWLNLFVLAVGLNSGNFSVHRLLPLLDFGPDQISQIRYLCIPVLIILASFRRPIDLSAFRKTRDALIGLVLFGVFLLYALLSVPAQSGSALYTAAEPYVLVIAYGLLTLLSCRDRRDVNCFLIWTLVVLLPGLVIYVCSELAWGPQKLATGYYFSRMFFMGFIVALAMVFPDMKRLRSWTGIMFIVLAGLFLFAGISTGMRASVILYPLSVFLIVPFLLAISSYARLALLLGVMFIACGSGVVIAYPTLANKQTAYAHFVPTQIQAPQPATPHPEEAVTKEHQACRDLIAGLSREKPGEKVVESRYSCTGTIDIRDTDARIRMVMTALRDTGSIWRGNGLGTYRFVDAAPTRDIVRLYRYPHNIYLEIYNGTGVIGLAIILMSIFFVLSVCVRAALSENRETAAILCLIPLFFMLSGAISGDIYDARYVWIMPLILAAFMADPVPDQRDGRKAVALHCNNA